MSPQHPVTPHPAHDYLLGLAGLIGTCAWLINEHYPPWMSFYNEFAAFLAFCILLAYCAVTARNTVEIPRWVLGIVAAAVIPLLQVVVGHIYFAGDGWMAAAYLMGLALAIAAGFTLAAQGVAGFAGGFASVLLLGATLSSLLVIYQWLDLQFLGLWVQSVPAGTRPFANLGQPNQLATLLCLGLAALTYLRGNRTVPAVAALLLALLLIFGIALTQSRVPWVTAVFLALWWLAKRNSVPTVKAWTLGLGLALYAGLIVFWPHGTGTSLTPATTQRADLTQAGTHFHNWQEMLRATAKEPWWGYGWNQVTVAHVQTAHERTIYSELLSHSHNVLLDLVIWNGLPVGLLIIAGLVWWFVTRSWRCRTPESWFALLALGCVGAHSLVEYPLDYAYFLLPIGLFIGLIEADQDTSVLLKIPRPVLWLTVVASASFMGLIWHEYRIVEADHQLMRFETLRIGQLKAAQPAPDIILLTQLREDLRMARSLARKNMSTEELEWMQRVTYRYPYYSNLFRYSVSLALNNRRQEASIEFRRLYDIYGQKPYENGKNTVQTLADTQYPELRNWQLP